MCAQKNNLPELFSSAPHGELIYRLYHEHSLALADYEHLLEFRTQEDASLLSKLAVEKSKEIYGTQIFTRGLIEISNICKNDCYYCGIRRSNHACDRYRLDEQEILECCQEGYELGFRTFVLQGGEDGYFTDERLCHIVSSIREKYPDCAITLSVGERSKESYEKLFKAGANRFLLRHETADEEHYKKMHPDSMSYSNRMQCLKNLKEIGYQVGCGFMVGSPFQTWKTLAKDLKFIEKFKPDMCGIGPFIPHHETPFAKYNAGTVELTCYLLSIIRLIYPPVLLPSTTALGTIAPDGREQGILSGANVVMPNMTPMSVRKKYELYENKVSADVETQKSRDSLSKRMEAIGYHLVTDRGDRKII